MDGNLARRQQADLLEPSTSPLHLQRVDAALDEGLRPALRICILSYRGNPASGGQGVYVSNLSRELAAQGHQVTVLSGPPYPDLAADVRLERIPGLDLFNGQDKLKAFRWSWLLSPLALREWASAMLGGFMEPWSYGHRAWHWLRTRLDDFDVVHDNQSLCTTLLPMQKRIPLVTTIHHPITKDRELELRFARSWMRRVLIRRWYSFLPMQQKIAPKLKHIITPSDSSRHDLVSSFGISLDRATVTPLGVDHSVFRPIAGTERIPFRIMTVTSADVPLKGLDTLLQAVAVIKRQKQAFAQDVELVVVGRPRRGGHTLRMIEELNLEDAVHFVAADRGPIQIAETYATASVAVIPSLYEGFGLPAVEAMASGVPLVGTRAGALPEVIGEAGIMVPPEHPESMAAAIVEILRSQTLQARYRREGLRRAHEIYNWEQTAALTVQLYRKAIDESAGAAA
ncbi:MAG: glycosyltransferase family 4 protein [Gammaproteobacteria bacterium]